MCQFLIKLPEQGEAQREGFNDKDEEEEDYLSLAQFDDHLDVMIILFLVNI